MPVNPLRRKLAAGETFIGPLLQEIPSSPELVEFLVAAGFDYVIVDGEHGGASTETCRGLVRAAEAMGGCFLGAGDLALSLGFEYFGTPTTHPDVQRLIDRVRDHTLAAGKLVMGPAGSGEAARAAIAQGVQLVVVQFGQFFRAACNAHLADARGTWSA